MKSCVLCGIEKPLTDFYFRKDSGKHRPQCKACWDAKTKAWSENNKEARKVHRKRWAVKNPENLRSRKSAYRKRHPIGYRKWSLENPELKKEMNRNWASRNKPRRAATAAKRRSVKKRATPFWSDQKAILEIYVQAAELRMEVDHIIPLQHSHVCGLHVPANLQILPMSENRRKSNRLTPWDEQ